MEPATSHPQRTVLVRTASAHYRVLIGTRVLAEAGPRIREAIVHPARRAFSIVDTGVPEPFVRAAVESLSSSGFETGRTDVTPSEPGKSIETLGHLLADTAAFGLERGEPIVAIGGGIVGDMAGLVAAMYRRGVPVVQCPTTLLSMVDASVGGKTAVNLMVKGSLQKNMAGAFHQPCLVLADLATLASLPDRVFRAGLTECVKHALLGPHFEDAGLLEFTDTASGAVLRQEEPALLDLVERNVSLKSRVVDQDEREQSQRGGRALLNLGHTFGHAIETLPHLSPDSDPANAPLQHGEAVALGLVAAFACSHALARIQRADLIRLEAQLSHLGLPTRIAGLPSSREIVALMKSDKKAQAGRLRLVLPGRGGAIEIVADPPLDAVSAGLDRLRAEGPSESPNS